MQELTSGVKGKMFNQSFVSKVNQLGWQKNREQNQANAPQVGIVSNFDPDQRGFLTTAMQGYTAVQTGNTGTLAVNPDFGVSSRYQNPDRTDLIYFDFTGDYDESYLPFLGIEYPDQLTAVPVGTDFIYYGPSVSRYPLPGGRQIRPQPGQPVTYYPVASGSPALNTNLVRGGKAEPYREYPDYTVARRYKGGYGAGTAIGTLIYWRDDVTHVRRGGWNNNSPLPPGLRYAEINDLLYENTGGIPGGPQNPGDLITVDELAALYDIAVEDIDQLLAQDLDGRPKKNVKPLPTGYWALHPSIYGDDAFWTGQVRNPLDWIDSFWYGSGKNVSRKGLETYLNEHPGCRFA